MGTTVGKNDSESGLIFEIDASNPRSYSGSGTSIYDLSGNNLTGTLTNGPTYSSINGGVIVFDGTNDYITMPSTGNLLSFGTGDFSISFWIYISSTSSQTIFTNYNAYNSGYVNYLFIGYLNSNAGIYILDSSGNTTSPTAVGCSITQNIWTQVIFTRTGTTYSCYKNGVFINSQSDSDVNYSGTGRPILLGGGLADFGYMNGKIANLSVYNRALGSSEVAQIFDATKGQFTPSLVTDSMILYLDAANPRSYGGSGTTWYDISGNNNHATLVNGVTYSTTNGGIFNLDGTDDYIDCPTTQTLYNANITIITGTRYNTTGNNGRILTSLGNNWLMGHWSGGAPRYYAEGWVSGVYDGSQAFGQAWHIYTNVQNYTSDTWSMYYENTLHASNSNGSQGPVRLQFCNGNYAGERSNCYVSFLLVYSKLLSTTEIAQNVDYFRGRFNI